MTSMLERCARAACEVTGDDWMRESGEPLIAYMHMARAVLTTLRDEPSEGVLKAGREHGWGIPADCYMADVPAIFAAMLTAALEE